MKKNHRKRFLMAGTIFGAAAIGLLFTNGIPVFYPQKLTLGVFAGNAWDVPDSSSYQIIEDAIGEFRKKYPEVEVSFISGILKEDYSEWLSSKIVDGTAPDVFLVLPEDFAAFSAAGVLKPLDGMIEKDKEFHKEDFYEAAYQCGNTSGVQYALPFQSVPNMMFVNKSLLSSEGIEVPGEDWTWEEFYEICGKVTKDTDGNGILDQFGVYNYTWEEAFQTNGAELFDGAGTRCALNTENVRESLELLQDLEDLCEGYQVTVADFDRGKVAFQPVLLSDYRTYKPYPWSIKKYSSFEWDCIPLPRGPKGANESRLSTVLMGINAGTQNKRMAWELLKTFTYNEKIQMEIFENQAGASALKKVTGSQEAFRMLNADAPEGSMVNGTLVGKLMETAKPEAWSLFRGYEKVKEHLDSSIEAMLKENKNKDVALTGLQREINRMLAK